MKIKKISYPTPLCNIQEIDNDNIDIFVELEDGNNYTVVVATPKNIAGLMEKNNKSYFDPGPPMIIVSELTEKNIIDALKSFCEGDAYWLKEYYLSGVFSIDILDEMINAEKEKV